MKEGACGKMHGETAASKVEISFDLVMEDDMAFVEGCYRLQGGKWHVFMIRHSRGGTERVGVKKDLVWKSGVTGINMIVPDEKKINKAVVIDALSDALGVTEWIEVKGPDSMNLR
jgi:hypothetical protein